MTDPPIVETRHLTKRYGALLALDDLCLTVQRGEVLGLLGPNGAGKTTAINLLLGVVSPTSGEVRLFGQSLEAHRTPLLRRVNFASAYAGLPPNLTPRENLSVFADIYEVPAAADRIRRVLDRLDLTEMADRRVAALSAGQRMRVVLAKALMTEPALLLLDEPTASLDPESATAVREQLAALSAEGVTLVWTSHNMAEVERYCSRVVFLHAGRVLLDGPPRELARRSAQVLVRLRPSAPLPPDLVERLAPRSLADGWLELTIPEESETAALIALVQNRVPIEGLEVQHPVLEDLFLRIAREQGATSEQRG